MIQRQSRRNSQYYALLQRAPARANPNQTDVDDAATSITSIARSGPLQCCQRRCRLWCPLAFSLTYRNPLCGLFAAAWLCWGLTSNAERFGLVSPGNFLATEDHLHPFVVAAKQRLLPTIQARGILRPRSDAEEWVIVIRPLL